MKKSLIYNYFCTTSVITLIFPLKTLAATLPTTCSELLAFIANDVGKTLSAFIGAITVIMMLIAAFQFLTAGGDAEKVKTARSNIIWVIVGLAIAIIAFNIPGIISSFLGGSLPTTCQ